MPNILSIIADNPSLLEALKEVLEKHFTLDNINTGMTNENMGAMVRARVDGLNNIKSAFREIATHKSFEKIVDKGNPGA